MNKPIVAGNWKLNKSPREARQFFKELLMGAKNEELHQLILFPPAINLLVASEEFKGSSVRWGAQNTYWESAGAFTGENSAQVVKELGGTVGLVGHSERREIFKETDEQVAKKVKHLQEVGLQPMLCVGETLAQREGGKTTEVISRQLREGLKLADLQKSFIVAYEPVWAIGTGKVATPQMAEEAHLHLRKELEKMMGAKQAQKVPLLYGGSVKPENSQELFQQKNIDGFLVGGASLKVESFVSIYRNCL